MTHVTLSTNLLISKPVRCQNTTDTTGTCLPNNDNLLEYGSRLQAALVQHRHTYNKIQLGLQNLDQSTFTQSRLQVALEVACNRNAHKCFRSCCRANRALIPTLLPVPVPLIPKGACVSVQLSSYTMMDTTSFIWRQYSAVCD